MGTRLWLGDTAANQPVDIGELVEKNLVSHVLVLMEIHAVIKFLNPSATILASEHNSFADSSLRSIAVAIIGTISPVGTSLDECGLNPPLAVAYRLRIDLHAGSHVDLPISMEWPLPSGFVYSTSIVLIL
jgi:hypothetical protein